MTRSVSASNDWVELSEGDARLQSRCDSQSRAPRQPQHSRAGRRQDFQPVFLSNLNHARDVLLLLRT